MITQPLGSIGDKVDLLISQGDDFGPIDVTLIDQTTKLPINLTGCSFLGALRKDAKSPPILINTEVVDAAAGHWRYWITRVQTQSIAAGPTPNDPASLYPYDIKMLDAGNLRRPVYYGTAKIKISSTPPTA